MTKSEILKAAKPIPCNTRMIQGIKDQRITITRRPVKPQPSKHAIFRHLVEKWGLFECDAEESMWHIRPKYYPGELLYAQEKSTWASGEHYYYADQQCTGCGEDGICLPEGVNHHKTCEACEHKEGHLSWCSPILMPKDAARFFLKVKDVRAELLQDITPYDACREGIWIEPPVDLDGPQRYPDGFEKWSEQRKNDWFQSAARANYLARTVYLSKFIKEYARVWDSIVPKKDLALYGWDANPWVWIYELELISES